MFSSINFIQTELQAVEQNKENYGYNYKLVQSHFGFSIFQVLWLQLQHLLAPLLQAEYRFHCHSHNPSLRSKKL
jgi:hypothetical protein